MHFKLFFFFYVQTFHCKDRISSLVHYNKITILLIFKFFMFMALGSFTGIYEFIYKYELIKN